MADSTGVREATLGEAPVLRPAPAGALAKDAAQQASTAPARRLHFMDNLRVALTVLIVLQHAGFAYAPGNWWYFTDVRQQPLLAAFFVVNRSFRMSLFFLIAGYFMPYVFDRKGPWAYLKDRFRRLGLPIMGFLVFVFPPLMYAYYVNFRGYAPIDFLAYVQHIYWGVGGHRPSDWSGPAWPDRQIGHLWFTEMLLVYAVLYAGWRWTRQRLALPRIGRLHQPRLVLLLPVMILVAVASWWIRLDYPIYRWGAFLGVLQLSPGDLPRDFACFTLGVLAFRNGWLANLPAAQGYRWLGLGLAGAVVFIAADFSGHSFFSTGGTGGLAMLYPCWETLTCFGFCLGLPVLFREHLDIRTPFLDRLSGASYGVYLFHLPLVVALQYAAAGLDVPAVSKYLLVGLIAVPASFALVLAARRSQAVRRVI
jgi:peptidoglycan/LPS O-acetylase OafA/YrhL